MRRRVDLWILRGPGWLLLIYLIYAQGISALNYGLGVEMGTQEPVGTITEVGVAFWYGFAFGDLVLYIPFLAAGLISHLLGRRWTSVVLGAAFGITVYWPIVCLAAVFDARAAEGWTLENELDY